MSNPHVFQSAPEELLAASKVASLASVAPITVRRLAVQGRIPVAAYVVTGSHKQPVFRVSDLIAIRAVMKRRGRPRKSPKVGDRG